MTDIARLAVDASYAAHGDSAVLTPSGGTAAGVLVIDEIASSALVQDQDGAGVVQLKPTVNIRESDLVSEPVRGTLVLKTRTWTVLASIKLNEFERQLILQEA